MAPAHLSQARGRSRSSSRSSFTPRRLVNDTVPPRPHPLSASQRHQQIVWLEGSLVMGNMLAFLGRDLAVDLGTANTLVYVRGRGIALNEPSVVALNTDTGNIVAAGVQAKRMIGRTPGNIVAGRPRGGGVIADFGVTGRSLRLFVEEVHRRRRLAHPPLVGDVP